MDNTPAPVVVITEETIRSIVRTEMDETLRQFNTNLQNTLASYPTIETVQHMIEAAVAPVREASHKELVSVDTHLRQSEANLKDATKRLDRATDRFEEVARQMAQSQGAIQAAQESQQTQMNNLERRFNDHDTQAQADRNELTRTISDLQDLRFDVHGNPNEPHSVSIQQAIADRAKDADRKHSELMDVILPLKKNVEAHDKYIESRRGMELEALKLLNTLLRNKWVIGVIIVGLGSMFGIEIFKLLGGLFSK